MLEVETFLDRVSPEPNTGCWLWTGCRRGSNDYGEFNFQGKSTPAHRAAFILFKGSISDGLLILHTCDVSACVNPSHLYEGTHQVNMGDMVRRGRCYRPYGNRHAVGRQR